ncbi:hypothetical protein CFC21_009504 [Triticum aestivum]|uniref:Uncharacterized protein n=2 Tax=Triticum aestivum TaxID=4565 RepID=A0A9R1DIE4_WHEAT|nr:hypothetical protein CFC21_009504 [Triticum aestivum]
MAASLRAAATRMLRPAVHSGEFQLSKSTLALEGEHCPSAIQQREQLHLELLKSTSPLVKKHRAELIEQKEELYELIALAHAYSAASSLDRNLLEYLSMQVKPRPEDPQWCKITRTKKVTDLAMSVAILATYGLSYCVLTAGPELVKYDGHVVTVESLPLLQGHSAAATDKGVHKEDMQKSRG